MTGVPREQIEATIRRIEEVRSLSNCRPLELSEALSPEEALLTAAETLTHEVEHHRRRLIETNILLSGLSELLAAMLEAADPWPALGSLCEFVRGAFRSDWVGLGLVAPGGDLEGCGAAPGGVREWSAPMDEGLSALLGADSPQIVRGRQATALVRGEAKLQVVVVLPLGRGTTGAPPESMLQNASPEAPLTGGVFVGRSRNEEFDGDHITLLESLAVSIASALENGRLNRRLLEALRFRDNVLESMVDGLVAVDTQRRVVALNGVAADLLGVGQEAAIGRPFPEARLLDAGAQDDALGAALAPGAQPCRVDGYFEAPVGERRPARIATTPLRDARGQVSGALATFFDLTQIRAMEARLRHLDRIAVLGRFTSSIAHEVKNPLAGIAAGMQYLGRDMSNEDPRRQHLDYVLREVGRLDRIVEDLSRATRPREPQPAPVDLAALVADAVQAVVSRDEARGRQIATEFDAATPRAWVDADHLQQVLVNLILNAVQAAPDSAVSVRTWGTQDQAELAWMAVEDSGPGIDADTLERVFEPFFTTKQDGTGLGLYICHEMVKRNGGDIAARNRPGGGAQFLIQMPTAPRCESTAA